MTGNKRSDPTTNNRHKASRLSPRAVYRLALVLCVGAISYLAFAPLTAAALPSNDKVNHIAAFLVLAWLAEGAYPGRSAAIPRWGLLVLYGLVIEVVQHYLPYRHFSLLDLAADVAGILAYVVWRRLIAPPHEDDSHRGTEHTEK